MTEYILTLNDIEYALKNPSKIYRGNRLQDNVYEALIERSINQCDIPSIISLLKLCDDYEYDYYWALSMAYPEVMQESFEETDICEWYHSKLSEIGWCIPVIIEQLMFITRDRDTIDRIYGHLAPCLKHFVDQEEHPHIKSMNDAVSDAECSPCHLENIKYILKRFNVDVNMCLTFTCTYHGKDCDNLLMTCTKDGHGYSEIYKSFLTSFYKKDE